MNDKQLRSKLIRMAHANPELRAQILPLLAQSKQASSQQRAAMSLTGLTSEDRDTILKLFLSRSRKVQSPAYSKYDPIFDVRAFKLSRGTIKRLFDLEYAEDGQSFDVGSNPTTMRLTQKGILAGAFLSENPDEKYEKVLGYPVMFDRRLYGRSQIYTWASVKLNGEWVSLGDPWPSARVAKGELERAVALAVERGQSKQAGCEKLPEGGMRDNCEEKRDEAKGTAKKAHGPVGLRDPDVMLYVIDKLDNKSKFYEMKVVPGQGGVFILQKRWGRLTDTGSGGRVDSKDEIYADRLSADTEMFKFKAKKMRESGYSDVSRKREYPIGLGAAGFGWGGQAACAYTPELRALRQSALKAMQELAELGGAVGSLVRKDSGMAAKLNPLYQDAVGSSTNLFKYLDGQLSKC